MLRERVHVNALVRRYIRGLEYLRGVFLLCGAEISVWSECAICNFVIYVQLKVDLPISFIGSNN